MLNSRTMIALAKETGAAADPARRDQLMRFHVNTEIYRLTGLRSRDLAKSKQPGPDGSMMKLWLAMLSHQSRDLSLSMLGAEGMLMDDDARDGGRIQRAGLSAFAPSLGGGTNEIQRNIIGERTLGLPREPGNDAEIPFRDLRRS